MYKASGQVQVTTLQIKDEFQSEFPHQSQLWVECPLPEFEVFWFIKQTNVFYLIL